MAVRVPDVHLANIPGHVGWRPRDVETLFEAAPVDGVDVIDPDGPIPRSLVSRVVALWAETSGSRALLPRPPWAFSQRKISALVAADPTKVGRKSPTPMPSSTPSFSNQEKLCWISDTLRIGVSRVTCMVTSISSGNRAAPPPSCPESSWP